MIIKLKVYSKLILRKIFFDKLNVSDSDGSEYDDFEGSASEGSDSGHDTSTSGDSSYSILIADLSCQHQT